MNIKYVFIMINLERSLLLRLSYGKKTEEPYTKAVRYNVGHARQGRYLLIVLQIDIEIKVFAFFFWLYIITEASFICFIKDSTSGIAAAVGITT